MGVTAEPLKAADEDYFHNMDDRAALNTNEVKGRNTWIVWTAGTDRMWNQLSVTSFGALDEDGFLTPLSQGKSR